MTDLERFALNPDLRSLLNEAINAESALDDPTDLLPMWGIVRDAVARVADGQPLPDFDYDEVTAEPTGIDIDGRPATDTELVVTTVDFFGLDENYSVVPWDTGLDR